MIEKPREALPGSEQSQGPRKPRRGVFDSLADVQLALTLVVILAVACIVGTLLPQGDEVGQYLKRNPDALRRMQVLNALGLTHVFSAWWFIGLLGAFSASLATCTARRFSALKRATGSGRGRTIGSVLLHASMLLILTGAVIRGVWGQKGQIAFREGETTSFFHGDKGREQLPFAVHLIKFEIETYSTPGATNAARPEQSDGTVTVRWPENNLSTTFAATPGATGELATEGAASDNDSFRFTVVRYLPDFLVDSATRQAVSRSDMPRNPAVQVAAERGGNTNLYWLFAFHPEFNMRGGRSHTATDSTSDELLMTYRRPEGAGTMSAPIKAFRSTLAFLDGPVTGKVVTIAVNTPSAYKGYTFYQSGYNEKDLSWTSLQVVNDPGVRVVYAGFVLMIAGLFMVFCLYAQSRPAESRRP